VILAAHDGGLAWRIDDGRDFFIDVDVSVPDGTGEARDVVAGTCLAATVGLSADHRGTLEAARMQPDRREAREVIVQKLESRFIAGFRSARPAPSYLMENVAVTWSVASPPQTETVAA
jgi:hypothetical protein